MKIPENKCEGCRSRDELIAKLAAEIDRLNAEKEKINAGRNAQQQTA